MIHATPWTPDNMPAAGSWPDPTPLPPPEPTVPRLDTDSLPAPVRDVIEDAAERASLPPDFFLAPALVALGATVGNRFRVQPKQFDDYLATPNVWGALVAQSGTMKSYASKHFVGYLNAIEADERRRYQDELFKQTGRREDLELLETTIKERRKKAAALGKHGELANLRTELDDLRRQTEETHVPEPRVVVNDATVEKLIEIVRDNPRGILMNRDELAGLLRTLDKPGREGDRAFYLESWEGTNGFTQDRIGRGTITADIVTLSIYGTIQPGVLREYQDAATSDGKGADGLLQRFQVLVWPDDRLPAFELVDRAPNTAANQRLQRVFRAMYDLDPAAFQPNEGGFVSSVGSPDATHPYATLRFDLEAQQFYNAWIVDLENKLRDPRARTRQAYISHISKYRSLLPSLAGLFHLVDVCDHETDRQNRQNLRIPADAIARASTIVDYLEEHARKVFDVEISADRHAAAELLNHISAGHADDDTTVRDLERKNWKGLTRDRLELALAYLEARHWLRVERTEPGPSGGRPSRVVRFHPNLAERWQEVAP